MLEIPALVTAAWTAIQPVLPIITSKGAEEIVSHTVGDVWDAIKKKFDNEAHTQKILVKLLNDPNNVDIQAAFRVALQDALEDDSVLTEKLSKLLEATGSDFKAQVIGSGAVAQGTGAKAVGAGGIYIGGNAGDVNTEKKK